MKKVTINGVQYLGELKEKGDKSVLKKAMQIERADRNSFAQYLKRENLGTLETVEFGGQGVSFAISELNDVQKLELDMCKLAMTHAKKVAIAGTENAVFEQVLGKR